MGNDAFGASWGVIDWAGGGWGWGWGVCLEGALVNAHAAVGWSWSRAGTSGTGDAVISKLGEVVCFLALLEWIEGEDARGRGRRGVWEFKPN